MRALLPAIALATALAAPAMAQEPDRLPAVDAHAIGGAYSTISGSGFSYYRTYANGWGWHVAGIGWGQGGSSFWNAGGAVTHQIDRRNWGTLYALLGAGAGIDAFRGGEGGLAPATTPQYNLTPGLGFTWGPFRLELGMSLYTNAGGFGFGPGYGAGLYWWL